MVNTFSFSKLLDTKISIFIWAFIVLQAIDIHAYEPALLNMKIPSVIEPWALEATIQHRFSRVIGKKSTYSFFDDANVQFSIVGHLWKGIKAEVNYGVLGNDFEMGGSYSHPIIERWLVLGGYAGLFSYDYKKTRETNLFLAMMLQSEILANRWYIFSSMQYEGFHEYLSLSLGSLIAIADFFDILLEYTPIHDEPDTGEKTLFNSFAFGFKINTYSHHFKIFISNATAIGLRKASRGAESNDLRFGFSIQKLFTFSTED